MQFARLWVPFTTRSHCHFSRQTSPTPPYFTEAAVSGSGRKDAAGSSQGGTITFYTDENGTGDTTLDAKLGLPKDLDGIAGRSPDVSATYTLLPFRIAVDWKDHRGHPRHTEVFSQVVSY